MIMNILFKHGIYCFVNINTDEKILKIIDLIMRSSVTKNFTN